MWYVVKGFTMIIVVPTDISCIRVIILIILHIIIIQIILSLSVLPISSFNIYVLRCMAVYSTTSSNSCNACVCHTYDTYVNYTPHQYCSTLHFISFSTKPTQTRFFYVCHLDKKETRTPNLWPGQTVAPHMMLHQELDDCCMKGCTSSTYRAIFFRDDMLSAKIGAMKSQREKPAFKDRQDPYESKPSPSYIHQLPCLTLWFWSGCEVCHVAIWKLLKSFTLSTTRWCTSILTKSIHCIYVGCSIDTYFWLMQSM